jgi:hypothetical protein
MPFSNYLPGYGFYYSLQGGSYFPEKAGPKSVVPAYAAMTFLVDGHKSAGGIHGLGDKAWGYKYRGPEDTIKALWSEEAKRVTVAVSGDQVEVFDWMGNSKRVPSTSGRLEVTIGPNPIYVKTAPGPATE